MRPHESKIGSLISNQSEVIPRRENLDKDFVSEKLRWQGNEIPRPDHWGGYKVTPNFIEFWQGRPNRLHDRLSYVLASTGWVIKRLSP